MLEKLVKDNLPSIIHVNQQSSMSNHEIRQIDQLTTQLSGLAPCLNWHIIDLSAYNELLARKGSDMLSTPHRSSSHIDTAWQSCPSRVQGAGPAGSSSLRQQHLLWSGWKTDPSFFIICHEIFAWNVVQLWLCIWRNYIVTPNDNIGSLYRFGGAALNASCLFTVIIMKCIWTASETHVLLEVYRSSREENVTLLFTLSASAEEYLVSENFKLSALKWQRFLFTYTHAQWTYCLQQGLPDTVH